MSSDEAMATPPSIPIATTPPSVCPKCGIKKKSGKPSCCFSGGAWFKNCGDASDPNFDHTWMEGARACEGVSPEAYAMVSTADENYYYKSVQDYASTADLSVFVTVLLVAVQMLVCQK